MFAVLHGVFRVAAIGQFIVVCAALIGTVGTPCTAVLIRIHQHDGRGHIQCGGNRHTHFINVVVFEKSLKGILVRCGVQRFADIEIINRFRNSRQLFHKRRRDLRLLFGGKGVVGVLRGQSRGSHFGNIRVVTAARILMRRNHGSVRFAEPSVFGGIGAVFSHVLHRLQRIDRLQLRDHSVHRIVRIRHRHTHGNSRHQQKKRQHNRNRSHDPRLHVSDPPFLYVPAKNAGPFLQGKSPDAIQ